MAPKPAEVLHFIARSSKRIAVTVVGAAILAAGLAMIVLPGPGIVVVAIGFAVLGTEYAWAATALERTKDAAAKAGTVAKSGIGVAAKGATGTARSVRRKIGR